MNNNGSKGTSLMSRNLMTPDEIKQLHYKTIILPTISHPIFRDTVIYKKISCYKSGCIERKIRPLARLFDTYFTVEQLKFNNINNSQEQKIDTEESQQKTKIISIINEVIKIFGKVDSHVEYKKDNGTLIALLYIAPPLSINDLNKLEELSNELNFVYNAISDKKKINMRNMNSLIIFSILDTGKNMKEM
jgi:hypothetical protein